MQEQNIIDDDEKLDKLFNTYNMTHTKWNEWYFRGVPNVDYGLYPRVWRKAKSGKPLDNEELFNEFKAMISEEILMLSEKRFAEWKLYSGCEGLDIENLVKWHFHVCFENYLLGNFYKFANAIALPISDEDLKLSSRSNNAKYQPKVFSFQNYWPNILPSYGEMMRTYGEHIRAKGKLSPFGQWGVAGILRFNLDIPQHCGVPTRLLDWTKHSYKALFFAAYHYLKMDKDEKEKVKNIALFAIRRNASSPAIEFIFNHSRYDNKFLHAQDGTFTRIDGDFYFWEEGRWPSIEDINEILKKEGREKSFELEINRIHPNLAWKILEKLDSAGINLSTMMPDYCHVAEHVQFNLRNYQLSISKNSLENSCAVADSKVLNC